MKTLLTLLLITLTFSASAPASEHLILSDGPALRKWENLRVKQDRHDNWWANFIRSATMRMDQLRKTKGSNAKITWLVYKNGYAKRSREDGKPYTTWISEQASKRGVRLIWVSGSSSIIAKINQQRGLDSFDYFGHSNKHCFLLDYSSNIMGATSAWLHEKELHRISRSAFAPNAVCKSWGCHTGQSMNRYWKNALGIEIIGAHGKTNYAPLSNGKMPSLNGRWIYKAQ